MFRFAWEIVIENLWRQLLMPRLKTWWLGVKFRLSRYRNLVVTVALLISAVVAISQRGGTGWMLSASMHAASSWAQLASAGNNIYVRWKLDETPPVGADPFATPRTTSIGPMRLAFSPPKYARASGQYGISWGWVSGLLFLAALSPAMIPERFRAGAKLIFMLAISFVTVSLAMIFAAILSDAATWWSWPWRFITYAGICVIFCCIPWWALALLQWLRCGKYLFSNLVQVQHDISPFQVLHRLRRTLNYVESHQIQPRYDRIFNASVTPLPLGLWESCKVIAEDRISRWDSFANDRAERERWMDELRQRVLDTATRSLPSEVFNRVFWHWKSMSRLGTALSLLAMLALLGVLVMSFVSR